MLISKPMLLGRLSVDPTRLFGLDQPANAFHLLAPDPAITADYSMQAQLAG
jgi:hypothetical protein